MRPRRSLRRRATEASLRITSRAILRIIGVRLVQRGPIPRGPALLVGNHLSWIDIVVALATCRCTFVAKQEVGDWPIVGRLARSIGVVFVNRGRKRDLLTAIPAIEHALRMGELVLLFPEGTTTDGAGMLPFRSALFEAAARARVPVFPFTLGGCVSQRDGDNPPVICWLGEETLVANLRRLAGAHDAVFSLHVGAPIAPDNDRKRLCAQARLEVARRFVPVRTHTLVGAQLRTRLRVMTQTMRRVTAFRV